MDKTLQSSLTILEGSKNNKLRGKKNFSFNFIKAKDLSKILVVRIKVYVQDPLSPKSCLNPLDLDISPSSTHVIFLKGSLHQAQPFFFLGVGGSVHILGRISTT